MQNCRFNSQQSNASEMFKSRAEFRTLKQPEGCAPNPERGIYAASPHVRQGAEIFQRHSQSVH
jgi:hypothetical protein